MINLAKDPKGYYVALGVDETASADDIKAAFRAKAKRLHPDHNPSPIAAKQFHRVREAYETLTDPLRRAAYDRGWRTYSGASGGGSGQAAGDAKAEAQPSEPQKPREGPRETQRETPREAARDAAPAEQPTLCKCGKVTAQPRYIVFDQIWGRLTRVQRRGLSGVYCRSCADRTAIRASLISWLAGWWAWPNGPRETIKAIVSNMRGGRRPPERNARLLIRQARAFRSRGEMELARACAEQAMTFAATPELRREVDSLLLSLSAHSARTIKDRWRAPGLAATAQALPLAALAGALAMVATLSADRSLIDSVRAWLAPAPPAAAPALPPAAVSARPSGRVFAVSAEKTLLRTGPSADYRTLATLARGTLVLVTEADPGGAWVRVAVPGGLTGFLPLAELTPEVAVDALNDLGALAPRDEPPP